VSTVVTRTAAETMRERRSIPYASRRGIEVWMGGEGGEEGGAEGALESRVAGEVFGSP